MKYSRRAVALLVALPMSTFLVACGAQEDTDARQALEGEALRQDIERAVQPDTTGEIQVTTVPLEMPEIAEDVAPRSDSEGGTASRRMGGPTAEPRRQEPDRIAMRSSPPPSSPRMVTMSVAAGTTMAARMDQQVSTESGAGSTFTATLSEAIRAADGTTLIPAGATVRGRVAEARESSRVGESARIELDFNTVSFDGESYPISATALNVPVKEVTRQSTKEKAVKIGGGAALGAILGQVIGKDAESTIAGAAIGAAAGTAVVIGTADIDAVIPEGSRIVIRLERSLAVQKQVGWGAGAP